MLCWIRLRKTKKPFSLWLSEFCSERMQKNVDPIFIKHISSYYAESYDNQHLFSDNATENERLTSLFSTYDMFEVRFLSLCFNS